MCLIIIKKLINNNIIMNDSMSILLATTILGLGGLGLYMYKTSDDSKEDNDKEEKYNEESIFGSSNLFNWGTSDDKEDDKKDDVLDDDEDEDVKPRRRNASKTQKNRKPTGSSRRRY